MSISTVAINGTLSLRWDFEDLIKKINGLGNGDQLKFDFSEFGFVTPESLIILVTASKLGYDKSNKPVAWEELKPDVYSYLERVNVNRIPFVQLKKPSKAKKFHRSNVQSDNLVEFTTITDWKDVGTAIQKTRGVINRWLPQKSGVYRNNLVTLLKETVENSVDHSGIHPNEGTCYYVVQKYMQRDGNIDIQIAVGDIGVGMLTSLRRVFQETKDDADAIMGALVEGKSGRKTGGGMGYVTIKEALSNLNGSLTIRSGSGIVLYKTSFTQPRIYREKTKYPGTQIIFHCGG